MKTFLLVFALVLLSLLLVGQITQPAYAWGPNTHIVITFEALKKAGDTPITRTVWRHQDAFLCGLIFPDVSVIYYYTNFESYQATHNWAFVEKLKQLANSEEELAFAYGVESHLIQDCIIHNYYVPEKIRQTLTRNWIIHPLIEGRIEAGFFDPRTAGSMETYERYLPLVRKALGRDFAYEAAMLRGAIGGGAFYQTAYTVPETGIWGFYKIAGDAVLGLVGVEDYKPYYDRAVQETVLFFKTGTHPALDPTGIKELNNADNQILLPQILAFTFVALLILWRVAPSLLNVLRREG